MADLPPHSLQILKLLLDDLKENHNMPAEDALRLATHSSETSIPLSIFVQELTVLEAIIKHLHERRKQRFTDIAKTLSRSSRSIWGSYQLASKKHSAPLPIDPLSRTVPIALFTNAKVSPSQILVMTLRDQAQLRFADIARLLHRDTRTIWSMYQTGKARGARK